jgi:H+/gluconate symporter-like permease
MSSLPPPIKAAKIPLEVFHRIAAKASGGMDTLPHNGAVITLLAVTGLTHRQAYKDVFVITLTKTAAVAIAVYYLDRTLLSRRRHDPALAGAAGGDRPGRRPHRAI